MIDIVDVYELNVEMYPVTTTGELYGVVSSNGVIITGAMVTAKLPKTSIEISSVTDDSGWYYIDIDVSGKYRIYVDIDDGFSGTIDLVVGEESRYDIYL